MAASSVPRAFKGYKSLPRGPFKGPLVGFGKAFKHGLTTATTIPLAVLLLLGLVAATVIATGSVALIEIVIDGIGTGA